mmetsp:Transcript_99878/g.317106  ORF Transcript_99878/g.317106 Transcript_99878/m.317106 type:complete len:282 (+) Transcript_99878:407-1252(+)
MGELLPRRRWPQTARGASGGRPAAPWRRPSAPGRLRAPMRAARPGSRGRTAKGRPTPLVSLSWARPRFRIRRAPARRRRALGRAPRSNGRSGRCRRSWPCCPLPARSRRSRRARPSAASGPQRRALWPQRRSRRCGRAGPSTAGRASRARSRRAAAPRRSCGSCCSGRGRTCAHPARRIAWRNGPSSSTSGEVSGGSGAPWWTTPMHFPVCCRQTATLRALRAPQTRSPARTRRGPTSSSALTSCCPATSAARRSRGPSQHWPSWGQAGARRTARTSTRRG